MPDESTGIIQQLIRDHRNMNGLLDVLHEELERYSHTKQVDFEVISRIVDYIINYPELRHHPREDVIFRHLGKKNSASLEKAEHILSQHRQLSALMRRLSAAVRNLSQDVEMPRAEFESLIETYIALHRQHMREEEEVYFPLALMTLKPSDWEKIETEAASAGKDPLFGGKADAEYQALHDRILHLAR